MIGLILVSALPGSAQEIRMANGAILKGEVKQATDAGLEIQSPAGLKTFSWETLSSATRFRYQPMFRANYNAVLQGLPPTARTNKPTAKGTTEALDSDTMALKETAIQRRSFRIFDQTPYENAESITPSQIPNLPLRTPNSATSLGLQYGPAKSDVIYLVFDPKKAQDTPDTLFMYSPGNSTYSNAVRLEGVKKGAGDARVIEFKKIKLNGRFGLITADFEIECAYSEVRTNAVTITISTDLYKGNTKSSFLLRGQASNLIQGNGIVIVENLLDLPVLRVRLDSTTGLPRLVGNLTMSRLKLVPKEGMEKLVWITLIDDKGEVIQRESIQLDESTFAQPYGIVFELKRPEESTTYVAKAAIDLGPYFGPAVFEEKVTIPAAAAK